MKQKNKISILLMLSPVLVSPFFLAASCKEKNNPELQAYKEKILKLQKNYNEFTRYVETSSVTNAKQIANDKKTKEIKEKLQKKLNKLSKIDDSFYNEMKKESDSIINKFKESLLNDLFNLSLEFNNSKFWSTFKKLNKDDLDVEKQGKINSLYSTIKKLNYSELSEFKFDNSNEDNENLRNVEEKLATWNELRKLVYDITNNSVTKLLDAKFNNEFWKQLSNTNDQMLKAFSEEFGNIKELAKQLKDKNILAQEYLLDVIEEKLENLAEIFGTDIASLDKTVKERFSAIVDIIKNQINRFDEPSQNMINKLIKDFQEKQNMPMVEDLNDFLTKYLKLLEKLIYKWMLEQIDDIFNEDQKIGKTFKELKETINNSNNTLLKKYLENSEESVRLLQKNTNDFNWLNTMVEIAKLLSLIENFDFTKKSMELANIIEKFEKNKIYDFELNEDIAKLGLKIKDTYDEAKKLHESAYSSVEEIENIVKKLNEILENPKVSEELRASNFRELLSEAKQRLTSNVDNAFDVFEANLKEKSNNPEKVSEALKTLIQAQKTLYEKLLEAFEEPFLKIKLRQEDYPKAIETLETLSILINDIVIEVLEAAIQNKDSVKDGLKFLNEILTQEFISKMIKKIIDFISTKGDILLKVIETIFTRLREVDELKNISILEGVIKESIDFYTKYVNDKKDGLMKKISELNIPSLTLDDPKKLEIELAPFVLLFRKMWEEHWNLLVEKFPGSNKELSKIGEEWNSISNEMFSAMKSIFAQAIPLATAHMSFFNEIIKWLK